MSVNFVARVSKGQILSKDTRTVYTHRREEPFSDLRQDFQFFRFSKYTSLSTLEKQCSAVNCEERVSVRQTLPKDTSLHTRTKTINKMLHFKNCLGNDNLITLKTHQKTHWRKNFSFVDTVARLSVSYEETQAHPHMNENFPLQKVLRESQSIKSYEEILVS